MRKLTDILHSASLHRMLRLVLLTLFCVAPLIAFSQSKKELEVKRKKLLRDIEVTNKLLKKTTKTKDATYDRYIALQSQIEKRTRLINTIDEEIVATERNIERNSQVIASLNLDVAKMQA
ncbi:MAG: hypothetical protein KDC61_00730, partial [Saprospiraceae bacterium]|nr:hypothetical protein [Saprospiraceae bacterium]